MLNQIKALLQDAQLRQKIKQAKTLDEAIELIALANAEKGDNFTTEDVTQTLTGLATKQWQKLSETDLLAVAGSESHSYQAGCTSAVSRNLLCNGNEIKKGDGGEERGEVVRDSESRTTSPIEHHFSIPLP